MNRIKKGLGRGLSSLIGETKKEISNKIPINQLVPNRFQPRKFFDEEKLNELSVSIKERGIIQPIIVRNSKNNKNEFEVIAGERRWRAAKKAGLTEVPVIITEIDDFKSLEFAIIENVQRDDLNPLEEAQGYQRLIDEFSYDHSKVSKFIGKSRSYITNSLRLLSLPKGVLNLLSEKKISAGHAKILVGLENAEFIASKILEKKLSVRQTENYVKIFKKKKNSIKSRDINVQNLENSLTDKIGLRVVISNNKKNKGSIKIEYKDLDQLNRLIDIIKKNYWFFDIE